MKQVRLNRRLTLETPQALPDGAGGYRIGWRALGELWADVRAQGAQEALASELPRTRRRATVLVRAAPPGSERRPSERQRFREGERVYRILAVLENETDLRFLKCLVEEEATR